MRIASQQRLNTSVATAASDEILSFGCYPYSNSPFHSHASLTASSNGNLAVKATAMQMLPAGGNVTVGSGTVVMMMLTTCIAQTSGGLDASDLMFVNVMSSSLYGCPTQRPSSRQDTCADGRAADLNVYGNVVVRPQSAPAAGSAPQSRRKLQQSSKLNLMFQALL